MYRDDTDLSPHDLLKAALGMLVAIGVVYAGYLIGITMPYIAHGGSVLPSAHPYVALGIIALGGTVGLYPLHVLFPADEAGDER